MPITPSVVIRVEARNRRTATATDYQTSPQGSATQVFVQEPVGPTYPRRQLFLPLPPRPSHSGLIPANQLAVSWTNVRADATRSRIVQINDKNQSDIGAWSNLGNDHHQVGNRALRHPPSEGRSPGQETETAPSYNVVDVRRTWDKAHRW